MTLLTVFFLLLLAVALLVVGYLAWGSDTPARVVRAARRQRIQPPEFVLAQNAVSGLWRAERFVDWVWNADLERAVPLYEVMWEITPDANKQVVRDALDAREATKLELNAWKQVEVFPTGQPVNPTEDLF